MDIWYEEKSLFSIRIKNRFFKEKSNDLNIDFILNFGKYIKKKAWSKENFEETLEDIPLSEYYVLLLDECCTTGIPVAFTSFNGNYYAHLNGEPKYIRISSLRKILSNKNKLHLLQKLNVTLQTKSFYVVQLTRS